MRNLALMCVLAAVAGLSFGEGKTPVSTFTDKRDGKVYRIVKIGNQVWFAENLNYAAEGSKCYGEDGKVNVAVDNYGNYITTRLSAAEVEANCAKYGRLYNWNTAMTACPAGTHLPSDKEWKTLINYVGGDSTAGTKLMSSTGWESSNRVPVGTDDLGWSALPGGFGGLEDSFNSFNGASTSGWWWSATEVDAYGALGRSMFGHELVYRDSLYNKFLLSVRCVAD